MHRTTIRRGAMSAAAALAFATLAAPIAHADVATNDATNTVGGISQSLGNVDAASVETSLEFAALPITDPVGSIEMGWESFRCFVPLPGDGPEDNCWY